MHYKGPKSYSSELKKNDVTLVRVKPERAVPKPDHTRKAPMHDSGKPDQAPHRSSTKR